MNFANFGIAVGALGQGVMQGLQIGRAIRQARDENQIRDLTQEGMDEAKKVREQGIDASIMSTPGLAVSDEGVAGTPQQFNVGGKPFATRDEATKAAEAQAPDIMSIYREQFAPKVRDAYLAQGNPEKADAFQNWLETGQARDGLKLWRSTMFAAQRGDWETAGRGAFKMAGMVPGDFTPLSSDSVKDTEGNIAGFNTRYRVNATGEERDMTIDTDTLLNQGLAQLAPHQFFEKKWEMAQADRRARLAAQVDEARNQRDFDRQARLKGIDFDYALRRGAAEAAREVGVSGGKKVAELRAVTDYLKGQGLSDGSIRSLAPQIAGLQQKGEVTPKDIAEMKINAAKTLTSDPASGFASKAPQRQAKMVEGLMDSIFPNWRDYERGEPRTVQDRPAPMTPAAGGMILYDPATGNIIRR